MKLPNNPKSTEAGKFIMICFERTDVIPANNRLTSSVDPHKIEGPIAKSIENMKLNMWAIKIISIDFFKSPMIIPTKKLDNKMSM